LGDINWLRSSLKLTTDTLSPLFQLLKCAPNPSLLQELTEGAQQTLVKVERTITTAQLQCGDPQQPVQLLILHSPSMPMGALWQLQGVLEWFYLGHFPAKVLT
jgi:hypothetical protein